MKQDTIILINCSNAIYRIFIIRNPAKRHFINQKEQDIENGRLLSFFGTINNMLIKDALRNVG